MNVKQSTIDSFFKKKEGKKKIPFRVKAPKEQKPSLLKIDLQKARKILEPVKLIKDDIFNNYKKEGKNIPRERIDKCFDVLDSPQVMELVSLFERPIPYSRKYWRRIATEFTLIREKNF